MNTNENKAIVDSYSRTLKSMVGTSLSSDECKSFIVNVLLDHNTEIDKLKKILERSITISIEDFRNRAEDTNKVYDESKYSGAIKIMLEKHDMNNGITWETIDIYLDAYCQFEELTTDEKLKQFEELKEMLRADVEAENFDLEQNEVAKESYIKIIYR